MNTDKDIINKQRQAFIKFMQKHNLKAYSWSKSAGVSEATIRHYLNGHNQSLTCLNLEKLAHAAGAEVSDLISDKISASESKDNNTFSVDRNLMRQSFLDAEEFIAQSKQNLLPKDKVNTLITWYELACMIRNDPSLSLEDVSIEELIKKIAI